MLIAIAVQILPMMIIVVIVGKRALDMKNEYYEREIKDILKYSYDDGYTAGYAKAKKEYGDYRGVTKLTPVSKEQKEVWNGCFEAWCGNCERPIESHWIRCIRFCPYCGKIIEWDEDNESKM